MNLLLSSVSPLVVDAVALVFVLVFAIVGYVSGFTKLFFKVFGTIISLLFAVLLCATVTEFLEEKFALITFTAGKLEGVLTSVFGEELMNTTLRKASEDGLGNLGLGSLLLPIVESFANDASIPLDVTLNEIICPTFAYYVVMVIVVVVLFIIFKLLSLLIVALTKSLYALNPIKNIDKLLGLVLGLISGLIYLELAIMLLGILPIDIVQDVVAVIPETTFTAFIQKVSLFRLILNSISITDIVGFVKNLIN